PVPPQLVCRPPVWIASRRGCAGIILLIHTVLAVTSLSAAHPVAAPALVVLAGATGDLGHRIALALRERGAPVRALVRPGNTKPVVAALRARGVELVEVDFKNAAALAVACTGASCVVSALSGLRPVIVDAQTQLLDAAV
nr:hypothetical protein [Tanacetum cinerariifolium]